MVGGRNESEGLPGCPAPRSPIFSRAVPPELAALRGLPPRRAFELQGGFGNGRCPRSAAQTRAPPLAKK